MMPEIFLAALLLFSFSFSLHILIWRWRRPRYRVLILFIIFFLVPLAFLKADGIRGVPYTIQRPAILAVMLLYAALSCAYIQTYPAVEAVSPSLGILLLLGRAMPQGLTQEQILRRLDANQLFDDRIQDLVTAGLMKRSESLLEPTLFACAIVFVFLLFRKILGLPVGEG